MSDTSSGTMVAGEGTLVKSDLDLDTDGGTMIQHGTLTADKDKPDAGVDDVESDLGTMVINDDEDDDDTMKRETLQLFSLFSDYQDCLFVFRTWNLFREVQARVLGTL